MLKKSYNSIFDFVWPMSIIMKALTSTSQEEIDQSIEVLRNTDGGTGFMHESFNINDANDFTRTWFAFLSKRFIMVAVFELIARFPPLLLLSSKILPFLSKT